MNVGCFNVVSCYYNEIILCFKRNLSIQQIKKQGCGKVFFYSTGYFFM